MLTSRKLECMCGKISGAVEFKCQKPRNTFARVLSRLNLRRPCECLLCDPSLHWEHIVCDSCLPQYVGIPGILVLLLNGDYIPCLAPSVWNAQDYTPSDTVPHLWLIVTGFP